MLIIKPYMREHAYAYARRWAFSRNPLFADYSGRGGNCTNFASQCALAASCVMNYTPNVGWYYLNDLDRSPSWTGVEFFFTFMTEGRGVGPFGRETDGTSLAVGDFIQLGRNDGGYYHTLVVVGREGEDYLVAAQSDDAFGRPLSTYNYDFARYIHMLGVAEEVAAGDGCFLSLIEGQALPPAPADEIAPFSKES